MSNLRLKKNHFVVMAPTLLIRNVLAAIGAVSVSYTFYSLACFSWLYLRPSSLPRYIDSDSYAIVTGATAGIGRGFVRALLAQGSNVIIHGRDDKKLAALQAELQQQYPDRKVLTVSASALEPVKAAETVEAFVKEHDIKVTILINNLGGTDMFGVPNLGPMVDLTPTVTRQMIDVNITFTVRSTQLLLPLLGRQPSRLESKAQPGLIMNMSSYAGAKGLPMVTIYAGCKAFIAQWSAALALEMATPGVRPPDEPVEVLGIITGAVESQGNPEKKITLTVPTSEDFAKAALRRVGCGRRIVVGQFWQALAIGFVSSLPESRSNTFMIKELSRRWEEQKKAR